VAYFNILTRNSPEEDWRQTTITLSNLSENRTQCKCTASPLHHSGVRLWNCPDVKMFVTVMNVVRTFLHGRRMTVLSPVGAEQPYSTFHGFSLPLRMKPEAEMNLS